MNAAYVIIVLTALATCAHGTTVEVHPEPSHSGLLSIEQSQARLSEMIGACNVLMPYASLIERYDDEVAQLRDLLDQLYLKSEYAESVHAHCLERTRGPQTAEDVVYVQTRSSKLSTDVDSMDELFQEALPASDRILLESLRLVSLLYGEEGWCHGLVQRLKAAIPQCDSSVESGSQFIGTPLGNATLLLLARFNDALDRHGNLEYVESELGEW